MIILEDRTSLFISKLGTRMGIIQFHKGQVTDTEGNTFEKVAHLGGTRWKCDIPGCTRRPRHRKAARRHWEKDHA